MAIATIAAVVLTPNLAGAKSLAEEARGAMDSALDGLRRVPGLIRPARSTVTKAAGQDTAQAAGLLDHIRLCPRHLTLYVGEAFVLAPVPREKSEAPINGLLINWSSSDSSIATVDTVGEVDAIAPGHVTVVAQSGHAQAHVVVDVLPGYRVRQTDQDSDNEHAHDCDYPDEAQLNDHTQQYGLAPCVAQKAESQSIGRGSVKAEHQNSVGERRRPLSRIVKDAAFRSNGIGAERPAAAPRRASVKSAPAALAPTINAGLSPLVNPPTLDGGNPDPTYTRGKVTAPGNSMGSPRFAAVEQAQGGGTKIKNLLASPDYVFTAPVISLPGRDVGLDLALTYNSQLWTKDTTTGNMFFDTEKGWPAPGWRIGYGRIVPNFDSTATGTGDGSSAANYPGDYLLIQPDGNQVVLMGQWNSATVFWQYWSTDGSFISYNVTNGKLRYPDGTFVLYSLVNNRILPTQVRSRNGNTVTIGYRTKSTSFPVRWAIDTITDNLGRVCSFYYYGDTNYPADDASPTPHHPATALAAIQVAAQNGSPRTLVVLDYTGVTLNYWFANVDASAPVSGTPYWMVNSITYPATGRGYWFTDYSSYGMIRKISVRQGMNGSTSYGNEVATTFYNYPADTSGGKLHDAPGYTQRQEYWQGKTDAIGNPDSTPSNYNYSTVVSSDGLTETTTVSSPVSPQDNTSTQTATTTNLNSASVSYGKVLSVVTTHGTQTLSTVTYTYTSDTLDNPPAPIPLVSSVATSMDGGPTATTTYTYDYYARVQTAAEQGFTSTPQRTTTYTYINDTNYTDPSSNLLNLVKRIVVTDNTISQDIARTDYVYDETTPGLMTYSQQATGHDYTHYDQTSLIRGNVTSTIQYINLTTPVTKTWTNQYDVLGNTVQQTLGCCQQKVSTFSQATQYSLPDSETSGVGPTLTTNYQYNINTSLQTSATDPDGNPSTLSYDSDWRVSQVNLRGGDIVTTGFDKDANANDLLSHTSTETYTEADGVTQKVITTRTWFDGAMHPVRDGAAAGAAPSAFDAASTVYDSMGRVSQRSNPYAGDSSGLGSAPMVSTAYDGLGRVVKVTTADSNSVSTTYNANSVTVTDQVGRQRKIVRDGLGRATAVVEQDPNSVPQAGTLSLETDYGYDMLDNLTQVSQGGQTRTFAYDALSRLTSVTTPEAGTVSYTYFDFNAVQTRTDARGVVTSYSYDGLNRLQAVSYPTIPAGVAPTTGVSINYKTASPGNGRPFSVTDGAGTETYGYDSFGRLTSRTHTVDGNSYQTQYGYNQADDVALIIYPSGKRFRIDYDTRGRMAGEEKVDSSGNILTAYVPSSPGIAYNAAQLATTFPLGNGISESYSYDSQRLQLIGQTATKGSSTLMNLAYSYQAAAGGSGPTTTAGNTGQLMAISPGSTIDGQARNQSFTYDNLARLASASGWGAWQRRYVYDRWGNRTGEWDATSGGNQLQSIVIQPAGSAVNNRIATLNGVSCTYDASGNLTSDGTHNYVYDAEGRLAKVDPNSANEADYSYNVNNYRVKKVTGAGATTTYCIWDGGRVLAEYSTAPPSSSIAVKYYHSDRLSTRVITDASGTVVGAEDTLPFGEDAGTAGVTENHRFTNYERDVETGTDYAVNRQFPNSTGKFTSPDPVAGSIMDSQRLNRYTYALNDPINLVDPLGLYEGCIHQALTEYILEQAGLPTRVADTIGYFAGDGPDAADSGKYMAPNPLNWGPGGTLFGIHFPKNEQLYSNAGNLLDAIQSGDLRTAGFMAHSIEDALGGHKGMTGNWMLGPIKHVALNLQQDLFHIGTSPDRIVGDQTFINAADNLFAVVTGNPEAKLTPKQLDELIERIIKQCSQEHFKMSKLLITRPRRVGAGGGGAENQIMTPSDNSWWASALSGFLTWVNSINTRPPLPANR